MARSGTRSPSNASCRPRGAQCLQRRGHAHLGRFVRDLLSVLHHLPGVLNGLSPMHHSVDRVFALAVHRLGKIVFFKISIIAAVVGTAGRGLETAGSGSGATPSRFNAE